MNSFKKFIYSKVIPKVGMFFVTKEHIPIIYYHNIVEDGLGYSFMHTELSVFKQHMEYLKNNNYKTYTFDQIPENFKKNKHSKEVIITFDDGFLSNYNVVFPIMKKLGLKYSIFITPGFIESNNPDYLCWDMIEEMFKSNLVGFGAHTYSHIDSRKINETNYQNEIKRTDALLEKYTQNGVKDFCFPFGYYNKQIIDRLSVNSE